MPTEISGSTGVNKIQDDTVVAADIASSVSLGKVLQAVTASFTGGTSTTSHDFQNTAITLAITPSASSSKVLALVSSHGSNEAAGRTMYYTLFRDSTNLGNGDHGMGVFYTDASTRVRSSLVINLLDSPNTTSSITYRVKLRSASNGSAVELPPTNGTSFITLVEIAG